MIAIKNNSMLVNGLTYSMAEIKDRKQTNQIINSKFCAILGLHAGEVVCIKC